MPDKPKKRRLKNPESFRERAQKASSEEASQSSPGRFSTFIKRILRSLGNGLRRLLNLSALSWLKRPLRLISKVIVPPYIRNSWRELKLVTWPSWKQSRRLTYAVLVFAVVFGAAIAGVDWGLDKVFKNLLLK